MIDSVEELQALNKQVDPKLPKAKPEDIEKDPNEYALNFVEVEFTKAISKFIKSYNMGKKLGQELMKNA